MARPQMIVLVSLPPNVAEFTTPWILHHLALESALEDFDTEERRLKEPGYSIRSGQRPATPSRTMYADDPDGNEVELICGL